MSLYCGSVWRRESDSQRSTEDDAYFRNHPITSVLDIIAHEYGWTHKYVLNECSRKEVFALVDAIGARYSRQHDDYERAKEGGKGKPVERMSNQEMQDAGFKVNE